MKLHFQNVPFTSSSVMDQTACFPILKTLCAVHLLDFCQFAELKMIHYFLLNMFFFNIRRAEWVLTISIFSSVNCLFAFFAHFILFFFLQTIFLLIYKNCIDIKSLFAIYGANIFF